MSDRLRRVLRTALQSGAGGALVGVLAYILGLDGEFTAALTALAVVLSSVLQNALEAKTGKDIGIAKTDEAAEGAPAL